VENTLKCLRTSPQSINSIKVWKVIRDYAKVATNLASRSLPHFPAMKDFDIRQIILLNLGRRYKNDPNTMIIEELGLCQGEARIDIAVVNGSIHGYEIKGDQDTLKRLAGQVAIYSRVLDFVTLVVSSQHLDEGLKIIPEWWGIAGVEKNKRKIILREIRPHEKNPEPDPEAIVQLIWRNEALGILSKRGLDSGYVSKTKWALWERIMEELSLNELREEVRNTLKLRGNWRSVQPLK